MTGRTLWIALALVLPSNYGSADDDDDESSPAADEREDDDEAEDDPPPKKRRTSKKSGKRKKQVEDERPEVAVDASVSGAPRRAYHHVPPRAIFAGELLGAAPLDSANRSLFGAGGSIALGADVYVAPMLGISAGAVLLALAAGEGMSSTTWIGGRIGPRLHLGPTLFGATTRNAAWVDAHVTYGASGGIRRPGFDVGAGIQWEVSTAVRLGPMVRYQFGSDPREVHAQLLTVGLAVGFGGRGRHVVRIEGDSDGDGTTDGSDSCPNVAAGDRPDPKRDGCPIPDADDDGVLDNEDECPEEAVGKRPDPVRNGCPFEDSDGDNITDSTDRCPEEAGEPNPFSPAQHGCPTLARVVENKIEILQQIFFETDSATIKDESFPTLQAVASAIKGLAGARVRVDGHTDQQGTDEYNLELSRRRARSVAQWLIEKGGVDSALIETQGYGRSRPIVSGPRADLRDNRRVEFVILGTK